MLSVSDVMSSGGTETKLRKPQIDTYYVGFEVPTAMIMKGSVFLDITPRNS
jgi:hypothetical protein